MDNIGNQVPISRVGDDSRAGITAAMTFQMTVVTTECAPPFQAGAVLVLKDLVHEPLDVGVARSLSAFGMRSRLQTSAGRHERIVSVDIENAVALQPPMPTRAVAYYDEEQARVT